MLASQEFCLLSSGTMQIILRPADRLSPKPNWQTTYFTLAKIIPIFILAAHRGKLKAPYACAESSWSVGIKQNCSYRFGYFVILITWWKQVSFLFLQSLATSRAFCPGWLIKAHCSSLSEFEKDSYDRLIPFPPFSSGDLFYYLRCFMIWDKEILRTSGCTSWLHRLITCFSPSKISFHFNQVKLNYNQFKEPLDSFNKILQITSQFTHARSSVRIL